MSIINIFKRKNAKPEFEVVRKAPTIDPASRQKYRVEIEESLAWQSATWKVWKGGKRIGISSVVGGYGKDVQKMARDAAEEFIIEHEFNGKIQRFSDTSYEVTVNRFGEEAL
jgi:hypothetical protein